MSARRKMPDKLNPKPENVLDKLQDFTPKKMSVDNGQSAQSEAGTGESEGKSAKAVAPKAENTVVKKDKAVSQLPKREAEEKIKVSIYIGPTLKRRMEKAQLDLRDTVDNKTANQINLSLIAEIALEVALEELDRVRENSALSRKIIERLQNK